MQNTFPPVELLAPAGGWPQLRAAVNAGADAVFFGVDRFTMRARAKHFSVDELAPVAAWTHKKGVRAYLTLNTIVYESELDEMEALVQAAKAAQVDAVIASDFAVLEAADRHGLPAHVSTQLSVSNSETLAVLFDRGVRRVVLARECTLDDVIRIRANLRKRLGEAAEELHIEVFAHGAMCVAVSGRCFMSGFETGRSANRGECAQPCRREYRIRSERGGEGFALEEGHVLSPKDLCTLPFLDQLLEAGVDGLKIEGRNRSPDYVHTVVRAYRQTVDFYREHREDPDFSVRFAEFTSQGMVELSKVYHRGFSEGFYMGKPLGDWTTPPGNQSSHRREYIGQVLSVDPVSHRISLRLESSGLETGEEVFIEHARTGYLAFTPGELWRDSAEVSRAEKGECVEMNPHPDLRVRDRIYRLRQRSREQEKPHSPG